MKTEIFHDKLWKTLAILLTRSCLRVVQRFSGWSFCQFYINQLTSATSLTLLFPLINIFFSFFFFYISYCFSCLSIPTLRAFNKYIFLSGIKTQIRFNSINKNCIQWSFCLINKIPFLLCFNTHNFWFLLLFLFKMIHTVGCINFNSIEKIIKNKIKYELSYSRRFASECFDIKKNIYFAILFWILI